MKFGEGLESGDISEVWRPGTLVKFGERGH